MWKTVKLGEICNVRRGTTITKKNTVDGVVPVIGGGTKPTYFHNEANRDAGCITVSGSGASAGFVNYWETPIFASDCSTVEIKTDEFLQRFVYYFMQSQQQFIYENFRSGAAQPHVYAKDIATLEIPVITPAEQQRIVAKLDAAFAEIDEAIQLAGAKEREIKHLQSALLSTSLNDSTVMWKTVKLGKLIEIARGGSPRPIKSYITEDDDGINWIKIGDTEEGGKHIYSTKEKIKRSGISRSRYVSAGDFLLSNSMSFGRPYILQIDGCIHDGWLVLSGYQSHFTADYLYYLLSSSVVKNQFETSARGSTVRNLNIELVSNVEVSYPPLAEQQRIVAKLDAAFAEIEAANNVIKQKLATYHSLKSAILAQELQSEAA